MKRDLLYAMLVAALLSGFGWQMYQRGAWQERARDLRTQMDSTNKLLTAYHTDSLQRQLLLDSLAQHAQRLQTDSTTTHQRLAATRLAKAQADSTLARLRAAVVEDSLPPPVRALLAGERARTAAADSEATACQASLSVAQDQRSTCAAAQGALHGQIASLEALRGRLTAERDSAQALLKPPSPFALTFEIGAGVGCASNGGQTVCGVSVQATLLRVRIPLF